MCDCPEYCWPENVQNFFVWYLCISTGLSLVLIFVISFYPISKYDPNKWREIKWDMAIPIAPVFSLIPLIIYLKNIYC
jgi:hypothetical protein